MNSVPTAVPDVTGLCVLDAALAYAAAGFCIIPVRGKHPAVAKGEDWQSTATTDAEVIRSWYPDGHNKGVAIVTGKSGVIALDVDTPSLVPEWLWKLLDDAAQHRTRRTETRRAHYMFLQPDRDNPFGDSQGDLPRGIGETKGAGYIVVEPSPHKLASAGGEYRWLSRSLSVLPDEIASRLKVRSKVSGDQMTVQEAVEAFTDSDAPEKLDAILRATQRRVDDGDARHDVFRDAVGWASRWAAAGYFPYSLAHDTLYSMWHEIAATHPKPGDETRDWEQEWEGFTGWIARSINASAERERRALEEDKLRNTGRLVSEDGAAPGQLPAEVWEHCENTRYIRRVAHAHLASAPAVLVSVLARIAAMVPPGTAAASASRGDLPLNLGVNVVGLSGGGKSTIRRIPKALVPAPEWMTPELFLDGGQLSTGQGLTAAFLGKKMVGTGEYRTDAKTQQEVEIEKEVSAVTRPHVLMTLDEGGVFVKNRDSQGSVTALAVRSAVTGDDLGQQNASDPRLVPAGTYSFGLVMNFQPSTAVPLFTDDEVTGGTPQRFIWTTTDDDDTPRVQELEGGDDDYSYDDVHTEIDPLPVSPLTAFEGEDSFVAGGVSSPVRVLYPRSVRNINDREIQGDTRSASPLDSHRPGLRSKLAALFALLDGRSRVSMKDWRVACLVWDASCEVRDAVVALGKAQRAEEARGVREAQAATQVYVQDALRAREEEVQEKRHSTMLDSVLDKVRDAGGRVELAGKGNLRQSVRSNKRAEFDVMLSEAVEDGFLRVSDGWVELVQ